MNQTTAPVKPRPFYGWISLTGVVLTAFIGGGAFLFSYGVFLPVMCEDFGWSRGSLATGLTIGLATFGLLSPIFGVLVEKFGARANMIVGNLLLAIALAAMALVQEVWHVYILYGIGGIAAGAGGFIASASVTNNWFIRKRPVAMGIFSAAPSLGGFIFPPLTTMLIESLGWRNSWLVISAITLVLASLLGGLMTRNKPEDMGQVPDGIPVSPLAADEGAAGEAIKASHEIVGWQTGAAMRQPATWLITVFSAASMFAIGIMIGHQVAYMYDLNFSPVVAALTMSLLSAFNVAGRLGFGFLAMKFDIRKLTIIFFIIQLIAFSILLTSGNLGMLYVYSALFGLSNGAIMSVMPIILGAYYGRAHFAKILGVVLAISVTLEAAGPAIAGVMRDDMGTYIPAFAVVAAFNLVGLVCAFFTRPPRLPRPNR